MNDGQGEYLGRVMSYAAIRLPVMVEVRVQSQPLPFQTFIEQRCRGVFFYVLLTAHLSIIFVIDQLYVQILVL